MSSKLKPTDWQTQVKIFEAAGFSFVKKGSHLVYSKEGVTRPVIIPKYNAVSLDIIKANMRTAKMDRETYLALLAKI